MAHEISRVRHCLRMRVPARVGSPKRTCRTTGGRQLGVKISALPGDQTTAGCEQREAELDQVGKGAHGPGRDDIPSARCQSFRASGPYGHPFCKPRGVGNDLQEVRLLADRFDQRDVHRGDGHSQWKPRKSGTCPDIDERGVRSFAEHGQRRETVRDMQARHLRRIDDGGEIDRGVPRDHQAQVVIDQGARPAVQLDIHGGKAGQCTFDRGNIGRWQFGKSIDARRERISMVIQPGIPQSGLQPPREPPPATTFVAQPRRRSLALPSVRGQVSPYPSCSTLPEADSVRIADATSPSPPSQPGYPRPRADSVTVRWITHVMSAGFEGPLPAVRKLRPSGLGPAADRPAQRSPDDVDDLFHVPIGVTMQRRGSNAALNVILEYQDRE